MGARKIPNNTNWFKFVNINPRGKFTDDCVIRAIALATEQSYNKVFDDLVGLQRKTGYMLNCSQCYDKYLKSLGWVRFGCPKTVDNKKFTGEDLCEHIKKPVNVLLPTVYDISHIVCKIGASHLSCIIDNKVNDIWNCSYNCVNTVWLKPKER